MLHDLLTEEKNIGCSSIVAVFVWFLPALLLLWLLLLLHFIEFVFHFSISYGVSMCSVRPFRKGLLDDTIDPHRPAVPASRFSLHSHQRVWAARGPGLPGDLGRQEQHDVGLFVVCVFARGSVCVFRFLQIHPNTHEDDIVRCGFLSDGIASFHGRFLVFRSPTDRCHPSTRTVITRLQDPVSTTVLDGSADIVPCDQYLYYVPFGDTRSQFGRGNISVSVWWVVFGLCDGDFLVVIFVTSVVCVGERKKSVLWVAEGIEYSRRVITTVSIG